MKLVGLMPVRNEAWCLGLSLRAALMWCDAVVILLHACRDESEQICHGVHSEIGSDTRIHWIDTRETDWPEMQHRQALLETARSACHATHIALIDADEVLTGNLIESIRGAIQSSATMQYCLQLPGYNLRGGLARYHQNGIWGNRWFSTAFRDDPALHWTGDQFHHREPFGLKLTPYKPIQQGEGGVMHLWGASERRLRAKHALYKITERLRWPAKSSELIEAQYNLWRSPEDCRAMYPQQVQFHQPWLYDTVPEAWWKQYADLLRHLDVDAEPWQESECRRLIETHGPTLFRGLDLFGVA